MNKSLKYVLLDILRNRFTIVYTICLFAITTGMFLLDDNSGKAILSLLNIVFLFVPLVSVIYTAIYYYNSQEFITLLLSQPIQRKKIFLSVYGGIALSGLLAFLVGCGPALLWFSPSAVSCILLLTGSLVTLVFTGLALLIGVYQKDKAKGLGISILSWIFFTIIYDAILLFVMFGFADYPMEKVYLAITCFNPVDLARILVLMQLDNSAMMGVTGAVFQDFFGSGTGMFVSAGMMLFWAAITVLLAARKFQRKDF